MKLLVWTVLFYLITVNLVAFFLCYTDKRRAQKERWRIPEATLLLWSGIGGAFGFLIGMRRFHHKTRHLKFQILIPLFMVLWVALIALMIYLGIRFF